ncbi:MAG TPA: GAF domain-containing protein, partial [Deltaproteobacteria bacterium]|nr:GAF domain-containing protein [Deltaproteobacteria bacterium]
MKKTTRREDSMTHFSRSDLAALHEIAKVLASSQDLRTQLAGVLDVLSRETGMNRGMISILDRDTKAAVLDVAHGVDIEGLDVMYLPGEGITGQVAQTGKPMIVTNLGTAGNFLDRTGARRHLDRSELAFLCVPIVYDDKVVGVLSADKVAREVDNPDYELDLLEETAELIAKAVYMRGLEE